MPALSAGAFPHVADFLRGYLHEDFAEEYASAIAARDAYLEDCAPDERRAFHEESARLVGLLVPLSLEETRRLLTNVFRSAWSPASLEDVTRLFS